MARELVRGRVLGTLLLAVVIAAIHSGCADRKAGKPKIVRKEGIAEKIDLQNNSVSMKVTDPTTGKERILDGNFREDTEVKINGRDEKLANVRPGDKVVVYGYREGEGEQVKLIATKVEVSRPEGSDWKSTSKPTDKPAEAKPMPTPEKKTTTAPAAPPEIKKPG